MDSISCCYPDIFVTECLGVGKEGRDEGTAALLMTAVPLFYACSDWHEGESLQVSHRRQKVRLAMCAVTSITDPGMLTNNSSMDGMDSPYHATASVNVMPSSARAAGQSLRCMRYPGMKAMVPAMTMAMARVR